MEMPCVSNLPFVPVSVSVIHGACRLYHSIKYIIIIFFRLDRSRLGRERALPSKVRWKCTYYIVYNVIVSIDWATATAKSVFTNVKVCANG